MFRVVENIRRKHLDWVQTILARKNWTQHRLAKEAGVSPSALNKFINDPSETRTLNSYTVEKLALASGMPLQANKEPSGKATADVGNEAELVPAADPLVISYIRGNNAVDAWEVRSRALELAGYLPGDILIVDRTTMPSRGDIVVAEIRGRSSGPEIVVRIFESPFLISATMDASLITPILINHDVIIRGVIAHSIRNRRAA